MKKKDFQKGAISVFLVIILIPCIVISGMFVDLSRVKLSQGVATSSADLALNSLMANYDKDLSEFYGLMASCQNIETFYEESAQFFLEALYSQGLSADDAESLLTYISTLVNNDAVYDLLQMEIQTETKDIISGYKGGNSTEASLGTSSVIMKDQIVEFMKYRAPIEIASNIIKRLRENGAAEVFGDATEDEQLVNDKQEYAESEEGFMKAAYKTYKALLKYEEEKMTVIKLKNMLTEMKNAREIYREITTLMVSNLNGTGELRQFTRPAYKINLYSYNEKSNKVYSRKGKDDAGNDVYYIDGSKITSLLSDLEDKIDGFKKKRDAVATAVGNDLINADIGTGSNQYNAIQWWKKVNSKINTGNNSPIANFQTSAKSMLDAYAKVLAIKKCTLGNDIPAGWEDKYNSLTQSVEDLHTNFLKTGVKETGGNKNNLYLRLINKLEKYSKDNAGKTNPDTLTLSNGQTVTNAIKDVDTKLSGYVTDLEKCINILDLLINGTVLNNPYSLTDLGNKAEQYHEDYTTWKNSAQTGTTAMAESDRTSIQTMESEGQVLDTSKQDILDFKTRLVNIRDRLNSIRDTINSMKFGGKELTSIDSYDIAYNLVKDDIGENLKNSEVSSKASSLFQSRFEPYSSDKNAEVKSYNFEEADYNPELTVSKPKFYKWMKEGKFTQPVSELDKALEDNEKKVDGKEDEGDRASSGAKTENRAGSASTTNLYNNSEAYTPADFPSGLDANGSFALGSSLVASLGGIVKSLVNMEFDGVRDSMYSTEYVMDMFSYATYENEGKYRLCLKNGKTAADIEKYYRTGKNYETEYSKVTGNKDTKGTWLSEFPFDTYNQSLTNKMINSNNNVLMGAEVEYVLYGKENESNILSAYVDIFEIRFLLNTLSGFQNFWTTGKNNNATAIHSAALAISGATAGIIPVPAIKCVAILLLTALETANDLDRLQNGFPVELYKKGDEWHFSIGQGLSTSPKEDEGCKNGLFYSDYLYMFVYLGFENESSASEMYRRVGDLIQVNMRKYTNVDTYMLKNARSYFELNATIRVKPLMLALPVSQGFSNNPKDKNDWCTFEIREIRGYS